MTNLYRLIVNVIHSDKESSVHKNIVQDFITKEIAQEEMKLVVNQLKGFLENAIKAIKVANSVVEIPFINKKEKHLLKFNFENKKVNEILLGFNDNSMPKFKLWIEKMPAAFAVFSQNDKLFPEFAETHNFVGIFSTPDDVVAAVSPLMFNLIDADEKISATDFPISSDSKFKAYLAPIGNVSRPNSEGHTENPFNCLCIGCINNDEAAAGLEANSLMDENGVLENDKQFFVGLMTAYEEALAEELSMSD